MTETRSTLEMIVTLVQVLSVVCGVVISVLSFNATRDKESEALRAEAEARKLEADRPFRELRRSVYLEAVKTAAIVATPEDRPAAETAKAKRRFRELYIAELTMVEDPLVESHMVALARAVDPDLLNLNPGQMAALNLAKALQSAYNHPVTPPAP